MASLGLYNWSDAVLAIIVGILLLAQLALFIVVGCLIIAPVWLISHWHLYPSQLKMQSSSY